MNLREELQHSIENYKKYMQEDMDSAATYEKNENRQMKFYMKGRADSLELVIKDLDGILESDSNAI